MTAFINESYYIIQSDGKSLSFNGSEERQEYKIQAAAQAPSGSIFTVVDTYGHLFRHDNLNKSRIHLASLGNGFPGRPENMMAISMPNEDITHAFWIEQGQMMFATIRGDGKVLRRSVNIIVDVS
jgi:hypothetical protein